MKILHVLALGACVGLAGCAAPSVQPDEPWTSTGQHGVMPDVPVTELNSVQVASLEAPADLWERIRRGFVMPDLDTDLVRKQQAWYLDRPDYIERMVERSRLYLFHIVEQLEMRDMPTELALLPYIESAFNPQAVSSARAAGMWQFMPATGASFDLQQNMLRDDRRDVIASTTAALDYLQQLHDQFGDWHLALAAYNWGQGNVRKAIRTNEAAERATNYLDLKMPAETRNYVPKLQAVKNIIAYADELGAVLPLIDNHPFFDTVTITRDIDVEVAAQLAQVRLEDFRALNPSQNNSTIFAAGTPQLVLPWDNASIFKKNLAAADPATLASLTAWVAPATLSTSEVAKRVNMDEQALRQINGIPAGMAIRKGSTLLVLRHGQTLPAVPGEIVNNARVAYAPDAALRRTTVHARRGDTIASIARRYDLPAATVADWNKLGATTPLRAGRALVVYLPVRTATASRTPAPNAGKTRPGQRSAATPAAATPVKRAAPASGPATGKRRKTG